MKCPICDGTGIEKIYDKRTNAYLHIPCATCHGTGHINQTNEEWFCQLPTEEKAKVIVDLGRKQRFPKDVEVEFCEQWLKEEHKDA